MSPFASSFVVAGVFWVGVIAGRSCAWPPQFRWWQLALLAAVGTIVTTAARRLLGL